MSYPPIRTGPTYPDAVRLLDASGSALIDRLDRVEFAAPFDESARWGNGVLRGLGAGLTGLNRFERTRRLVAGHTVLVVTAYLEAVLARIAGGDVGRRRGGRAADGFEGVFSMVLLDLEVPLPSAAVPFEAVLDALMSFYGILDVTSIRGIAGSAVARYRDTYRRLAAEIPEFAVWGAGTTDRIGELDTSLAGLGELLRRLAGPDSGRADLARRYRADLGRPIVEVGDLPGGVTMPTLEALYVNPRCRVRRVTDGSSVAAEQWWASAVDVADIQAFLAGYLTGSEATETPLLVLGQPGSGKSLLSRILAARLPAPDFLPVRVELRTVAADAAVQEQVEHAVHRATGERVSWPRLVRSSDGALPVVLLDGFDELLQATGVNRADYLEEIRAFQQREAELGRPVVVVVTSRIVVADRARVPAGSVVLRLDPFDDEQIGRWLDVWSAANLAGLGARSLTPLPTEVARRYRDLAGQPLLLLMLALYDAGANALQRDAAGLAGAELYERLFADFARRELRKQPAHDGEPAAVEREIRRLAIVALSMFNRRAQVVTERQLDGDLAALALDGPAQRDGATGRPLTAAQLLVGRFFFIHESRARRDTGAPEKSYEFLHATFGEFLVARTIVRGLAELAEDREYQAGRLAPSPLDAGRLYASLSFTAVTSRGPVLDFCAELFAELPAERRDGCRRLALDLLRHAAFPQTTWSLSDYEPVRRPAAARHAAFSANLVLLVVMLSPRGVYVSDLVAGWRSHTLLWESQLSADEWRSLYLTLRARVAVDDIVLDLVADDTIALPEVFYWADQDADVDVDVPTQSLVGQWLLEAAFRGDSGLLRVLAEGAAPFWRHVGTSVGPRHNDRAMGLALGALLEVMLAPRSAARSDGLLGAYRFAFGNLPGRVLVPLLAHLERDQMLFGPRAVADVLVAYVGRLENLSDPAPAIVARITAATYVRAGDVRVVERLVREASECVRMLDHAEVPAFEHLLAAEIRSLGKDVPAEIYELAASEPSRFSNREDSEPGSA
ncbi:ATP-binding protein [Dactylosporangium sp. AC04546]|uniref:NACHT domain-containing protein n=1 Tax=Dactylosporangium sp. AC04546 TaxID=2862460 RepID=UPI001EDDF7E2|nr:ATP-binding protein [Dactylosporangium sp. AC04546]WVK88024.1 ATP-binding protein [Dactylosporangium sp. AC04546]